MSNPAEVERRRVIRQRRIVIGVFLTFFGGFIVLLAPDLVPVLKDLPFLAAAILCFFLGGILLGVGFGSRTSARP